MRDIARSAAALLIASLVAPTALAQQTVGLFKRTAAASSGYYTIISPNSAKSTYLIDMDGRPVHQWTSSYAAGLIGFLRPNGNLVRAGSIGAAADPNFKPNQGGGGILEEYDWNGNLVWSMNLSDSQFLQHHDIEILPNGNILATRWEFHTAADAIAAGRDPANVTAGKLWSEQIIEIQPTLPSGGTIVWSLRSWDHMVQQFDSTKANYGSVSANPQRFDMNPPDGDTSDDFQHCNSVKYNPDLDEIIINFHRYSEFFIIDHGTTTAQAATESGGARGHGGAILYRWGNPMMYGRGTAADEQLFNDHDAHWIKPGLPGAGNILIFNNGLNRPGNPPFSEVDEVVPPLLADGTYTQPAPTDPYGPAAPVWKYVATPPSSFYSSIISGTDRMPNGNTAIDEGTTGRQFEIDTNGNILWQWINPVNGTGTLTQGQPLSGTAVFKIRRYPSDFSGFVGHPLIPGPELEQFTSPKPVPDGSLTANRTAADGSVIDIAWDSTTCLSNDYNLLFGRLADLPLYGLLGSQCSIGTTGTYEWTAVPTDDLYFILVGRDPSGLYESSWGSGPGGAERHGTSSSFLCGATQKAEFASCP